MENKEQSWISSSSSSASSTEERHRREASEAIYEREVPPIIYDDQTDSLTYASQKVDHVPIGLWNLYPKTKRLDLSYNHINSFKYIENFEDLTELILDNNCITERVEFPILHSLKLLSLNNNRVTDLPEFVTKARRAFPHLRFLSLLRNKACPNKMYRLDQSEADYQRYRLFIIHNLPRLKYLDSTKVTEDELDEAQMRGHLLYLRTPRYLSVEEERAAIPFIPANLFENIEVMPAPKHRGEYLRTYLSFANKESEGNRFITNQDL